jgi:AraC-like DNA-binding protein
MLRYLALGGRDFRKLPDPPACRTSWEFYAAIKGRVAPVIEGRQPLQPVASALWLIRPALRYRWVAKPFRIERVSFQFTNIPEVLRQKIRGQEFLVQPLNVAQLSTLRDMAERLMPHFQNPTDLLELHSDRTLIDLALLFLENFSGTKTHPVHRRERERVQLAEELYLEHIIERPTIDRIAADAGVSTSQLRRDFKSVYGLSPQIIFRRMRIREAARLLSNSDLTLDLVALQAGFSGKVDFHRAFKQEYKVTPHCWRKRISV